MDCDFAEHLLQCHDLSYHSYWHRKTPVRLLKQCCNIMFSIILFKLHWTDKNLQEFDRLRQWKLACPGLLTLYQGTRWFSVMHQLQDWMDGPGRLGVGQPKPFVYTSPAEIRLLLTKRERWIFYNRWVILALIHWFGHSFFSVVIRTHTSNLKWEAC